MFKRKNNHQAHNDPPLPDFSSLSPDEQWEQLKASQAKIAAAEARLDIARANNIKATSVLDMRELRLRQSHANFINSRPLSFLNGVLSIILTDCGVALINASNEVGLNDPIVLPAGIGSLVLAATAASVAIGTTVARNRLKQDSETAIPDTIPDSWIEPDSPEQ